MSKNSFRHQLSVTVDLTQLNKSVQQEQHIVPLVEHILTQLSGPTVLMLMPGFGR